MQGAHHQILPFTDDVSIRYELLGKHAHYGRLPGARRELRPSPRLDLTPDDYDEGEMLANMVGGLGGAFLGEERALVADAARGRPRTRPHAARDLRGAPPRPARRARARRLGVRADQMASVDDVFVFPNIVGPVYPGQRAHLPRPSRRTRRPRPRDPRHLGARVAARPTSEAKPLRAARRSRTGATATGACSPSRTTTNLERVQRGMHSDAFTGLRLNPRQEINLLHMHHGIDEYLTADDLTRPACDIEPRIRGWSAGRGVQRCRTRPSTTRRGAMLLGGA